MNPMAYIWLLLLVGFLIVEGACPIHLVSVWFALGALAAMVAALLDAQLWLQLTVFIVVSLALLACLWPLVKKFLNPNVTATNVDSIIGTQGYVTADIDNLLPTGTVKLGGMEWTARSISGERIPAGTLVKVEKIEGVKAFVSVVPTE